MRAAENPCAQFGSQKALDIRTAMPDQLLVVGLAAGKKLARKLPGLLIQAECLY